MMVTDTKPVIITNERYFRIFGEGNLFGLPAPIAWTLAATIGRVLLLHYNIFGRRIYAAGGAIIVAAVDFTDPAKVSQIASDFLTADPDIKGVFAVWDQPALDTLSSMRAQNINIPVTTVDLGLQSAIEIAKGGPTPAYSKLQPAPSSSPRLRNSAPGDGGRPRKARYASS